MALSVTDNLVRSLRMIWAFLLISSFSRNRKFNNPTGNTFDRAVIEEIIIASDALVVLDEAYYAYANRNVPVNLTATGVNEQDSVLNFTDSDNCHCEFQQWKDITSHQSPEAERNLSCHEFQQSIDTTLRQCPEDERNLLVQILILQMSSFYLMNISVLPHY
jgi:hypothetical protein